MFKKKNICVGEHKVHFVPTMVGPFLEVTMVPEADLRKATLNIFFDMMQTEEKIRGNFKAVCRQQCTFICNKHVIR